MKHLSVEEYLVALRARNKNRPYLAMYSSWAGGIVTDVELMLVPVDDHLVHRGDGVFEALQYSPKGLFELEAHVKRLFHSSELIGLKPPISEAALKDICLEVVKASGVEAGQLRIYLSRGPGDFSPNPYSTLGPQLYVVAMPPAPEKVDYYTKGAKLCVSTVPTKPYPFAQIKSCNYLQNVMTKKESVDRGFDFAINLTPEGHVSEGPTENILVFTRESDLVAPPFDYSLRGTTLSRVMQLAEGLKASLSINAVIQRVLWVEDLKVAKEIMMVGTTLGVCPVTWFENQTVGDGQVGPVARRLHDELKTWI